MVEVMLHESTQALLNDPLLGEQDIDGKIRQLLHAEYLRRLARYHRTDSMLAEKYGMGFDEFVDRRVTRERNYGWDVEQDAMKWETAIGGMLTVERKLREVRTIRDEWHSAEIHHRAG